MPRARMGWKGIAVAAAGALIASGVSQAACGSPGGSSAGDDGGAPDTSAGSSGGSGGSSGGGSSGGSSGSGSGSSGAGSSSGSGSGSSSGGSSGGQGDAGNGGSPDGGGDAGTVQPTGNVPGTWKLAFDDEFNGANLDTTKWTTMSGGGWGSTTCATPNVSVSGGNLVLTLASKTSGGCVCTGGGCAPAFGGSFSAGSGSYSLPVGGYTEARVSFPGSATAIDNWPAWWTSGPGWPAGGEHDIAEGLGKLSVTYHSPSGSHGQGAPSGTWSNAFHVYGLYRATTSAKIYYDGTQVASYATDDNGAPESLIFDVMDGYGQAVYGAGSQVLVDYVRAWQ